MKSVIVPDMRSVRLWELAVLFVGDLLFLFVSLWLTLFVRYGQLPSWELYELHVVPFSMLFVVWLLIFFIAGLYDQHTTIFRARLPDRILRVQIGNIIIAALFFFFVPIFGIAPKTNLLLYLIISFVLIVLWRVTLVPRLLRRTRAEALLIAGGAEYKELLEEVNENARYPFFFADRLHIDKADGGSLSDQIFAKLKNPKLEFVVVDVHHKRLALILPHLYKPIFSNVEFIDARDLYEEIFERIPLSVLDDPPFLESLAEGRVSYWYTIAKRIVDIIGGLVMGIITILAAPFIWVALRLEGPGPLFIVQDRVGMRASRIKTYKFRSMTRNDKGSTTWVKESDNKVTRVGAFLRRISLDEFPQFINILAGELSVVGPRNDIEGLAKRLSEAIPFYDFRYVVKPGVTGWAQINQQYEQGNISPQSIEETKVRLAYDFYYIKHRSLMLDIIIALKTLKRMLFRMSSW